MRGFRELEKRLCRSWSRASPSLSPALTRYRKAWLDTLSAPSRTASEGELVAALGESDPILLGDYHSLLRARRGLGTLIRGFPRSRTPGILLELLSAEILVSAQRALEDASLRLIDGQSVAESHRFALRALARRGGLVAGAWKDGPPHLRDRAAAERWMELRRAHPGIRWLLFFGDWHLAEGHLPRELRHRGARPLMIHQSPEPLWNRLGGTHRERILEMGSGHWAWLRTPPLEQWASVLQSTATQGPEAGIEIAEDLIEELASCLAELLHTPRPEGRLSVWPRNGWEAFRATLPGPERRALDVHPRPEAPIFHPSLPALWLNAPASLATLVEGAAHLLAQEHRLNERSDLAGRIVARAFRRLLATLVNPFLQPSGLVATSTRFFPNPRRRPDSQRSRKLLAAWQAGREVHLGPRRRLLAVEWIGARAARGWAEDPRLDRDSLRSLLERGGDSLGWAKLTATIRVA